MAMQLHISNLNVRSASYPRQLRTFPSPSCGDSRFCCRSSGAQSSGYADISLAALGLPSAPDLEGRSPRSVFSATTLAYLGDAVWEVLVRSHVFQQSCSTPFTQGGGQKSQGKASSNAIRTPPGKLPEVQLLNSAATRHSNARSQALYYDFLVASPLGADGLPPDDAQPSEQAPSPGQRSASSSGPTSHSQQLSLSPEERDLLRWARNASGLNPPPGTDTLSYKKATAVEALVAHLYLTDSNRCVEFVNALLASHIVDEVPMPVGNHKSAKQHEKL